MYSDIHLFKKIIFVPHCQSQHTEAFTQCSFNQQNRPYSKGIGTPAAAIPLFLKLCRGKSSVEENLSVQTEVLLNPHECTIFIDAQLIRTGLVLCSYLWDSQCTQKFPASRFSLGITFKCGIAFAYQPIPLVLDYCCQWVPPHYYSRDENWFIRIINYFTMSLLQQDC